MKQTLVAVALGLVAGCANVQDRTQPAAAGATASPTVFTPLPGPSQCWESSLCRDSRQR
jgi:hypothetical protein